MYKNYFIDNRKKRHVNNCIGMFVDEEFFEFQGDININNNNLNTNFQESNKSKIAETIFFIILMLVFSSIIPIIYVLIK